MVAIIGAHSGAAFANSRAPRTEPAMPSSAATRPTSEAAVKMLREDLTFRCQRGRCRVSAAYLVESDRPMRATLDFLLPVDAPVTARLGSVPALPKVVSAERMVTDIEQRLNLRQNYFVSESKPLPPLYQASVSIDFIPGRNQITFEYEQPLAAKEYGHSYFSKGRMVPEFIYLLWPLKEWTRAKDFAIELRIEVDRAPPSWWKRMFGHPVTIACHKIDGGQQQVGGQLVFRARLADPFPDVLDCQIGDDDLVK